MHYLVAVDTVHTAAAACDYLEPRLGPDDTVEVLTVVESTGRESRPGASVPGSPDSAVHDAADAANVVTVRLAGRSSVETLTREGPPAETVVSLADEHDVDVVLVGTHGGGPGTGPGLGSVARAVVERCDRPVVVLPVPSLDA